ncbi:MAG: ATP-binding protein [Deltaproteobacteria bacterium]|nr:ATP-binding protein [Deltaproteobacteria bacterium]
MAERIVAEHEALVLPEIVDRDVRLPSLPGKADALVGMRRSGKTWRVLQHLRDVERAGVPRTHTLFVNLEDERLRGADVAIFGALVDAAFRRDPSAASGPFWLLLDEVQAIAGWESFVRRMLDTRSVRVVIAGSSAKLLSREVATSLRGRSLATEILPFSLREALRYVGWAVPARWPPPARGRAELERAVVRYLTVGGFPEVQPLDPALRRRVLQEYVDVTLFRDVVERHGATNVVALRRLVTHLLRSPAGKLSVNKLYNHFRSQGIGVAKDALHEYVGHLEDASFVFTVPLETHSERRRAVHPRKAYLVDPGLAHVAAFDALTTRRGHLLENAVYLELRRRGAAVTYHVSETGSEVDFVARHPDGGVDLIQVSADLDSEETIAREARGLGDAAPAYPKARLLVVTMTTAGTMPVGRRKAAIVPAWRFLLEE